MKAIELKDKLDELFYEYINHADYDYNVKTNCDEKSIELINQFKKDIELETLQEVEFAFRIQSDLSTKTIEYKRLCERIKQLKNK